MTRLIPWCAFAVFQVILAAPARGDDLASGRESKVIRCEPGPWGDLSYSYLYIEPSTAVLDLLNVPSEKTTWVFPGRDFDQAMEFLAEKGMTEEDRNAVSAASEPYRSRVPLILYPPPDVVLGLDSAVRSALYAELGRSPVNRFQHQPFILGSGDLEQWFSGSGLSGGATELIEKMSYPIGGVRGFSDVPYLVQFARRDLDYKTLLGALSRTKTMVLQLKVTPESDFKSLRDYWTSGRDRGAAETYLDSLRLGESPAEVDVAQLLPPTPRQNLYRYPSTQLGLSGSFPDGRWAAFNFFNYKPLDLEEDPDYTDAYISENFTVASQPYQFGDVILVEGREGRRRKQYCAYIAAGIVYAKHGRGMIHPFVFAELAEVISRYRETEEPSITVYRRNR